MEQLETAILADVVTQFASSCLGYRTPQEFAAATRAAEAGSALMAPPSSAASPELKNVV